MQWWAGVMRGKIAVYIQYLNLLKALHRLLIAVSIYISTQSKLPVHYLSQKMCSDVGLLEGKSVWQIVCAIYIAMLHCQPEWRWWRWVLKHIRNPRPHNYAHNIHVVSPLRSLWKVVSSVYKCSSCSPLVPEPFSRPPAPVISIIGAPLQWYQLQSPLVRTPGTHCWTTLKCPDPWRSPINNLETNEYHHHKWSWWTQNTRIVVLTRTLGPDITMARESGAVSCLCSAPQLLPSSVMVRTATHQPSTIAQPVT